MDTITYTRNEIELEAYPIDPPLVLLIDRLQPFDRRIVDTIDDFDTFIMPNGLTASEYYQSFIVDIDTYMDMIESSDTHSVYERVVPVDQIKDVRVNPSYAYTWLGVTILDENMGEVQENLTEGSFAVFSVPIVHPTTLPVRNGVINSAQNQNIINITTPVRIVRVVPKDIQGGVYYKIAIYQTR